MSVLRRDAMLFIPEIATANRSGSVSGNSGTVGFHARSYVVEERKSRQRPL